MPNQKFGMLMPKKPTSDPRLSIQELGLPPAQTPSGTATTMAITIDNSASSIVAGSRSAMTLSTGSAKRNDVPRSPCSGRDEKLPVLDPDRLIETPALARQCDILVAGIFR